MDNMQAPTQQDRESAHAKMRAASQRSFMTFIRCLRIDSYAGPVMFDDVMAGFQRKAFEDLSPSLHAVRSGGIPPIRRFWLERTKKAGKDSDLGACLLWLCAWPSRPFYGQVGAADQEQARIVKRRIKHLLLLNKWLNEFVVLHQNKIKHKGGLAEIDILAADVAGSHGETPQILVLNELAHVQKSEFLQNLMDNADGVRNGIVICATNAGFRGTMPHVWRQNAIRSDNWSVHVWKEPAPWHSKEQIAEARQRNRAGRFKRLWKGQWQSGKGEALDEMDVNRIFSHNLGPLAAPVPGWVYIGGLDLGVKHDHSGFVVVGINVLEQIVRVVHFKAWEPERREAGREPEVWLPDVEAGILTAHRVFGLSWIGYDPSQAQLMAQRLRSKAPMQEVPFVAANLTAMAESLVQMVEDGTLQAYDDSEGRLRRDLGKFEIAEKTYGYKLQATSDEFGHADVGTALVITLAHARDLLKSGGFAQDDFIAATDGGRDGNVELTQSEVGGLDEGLRDVYDYYGEGASENRNWPDGGSVDDIVAW